MRPTIGTGQRYSAHSMSASACASARFCSQVKSAIWRIHARSAPAQNALPWPPSTIARSEASAPSVVKASPSSAITASLKALRTSGRLSQTRATPPSRSICKAVVIGAPSRRSAWCPLRTFAHPHPSPLPQAEEGVAPSLQPQRSWAVLEHVALLAQELADHRLPGRGEAREQAVAVVAVRRELHELAAASGLVEGLEPLAWVPRTHVHVVLGVDPQRRDARAAPIAVEHPFEQRWQTGLLRPGLRVAATAAGEVDRRNDTRRVQRRD